MADVGKKNEVLVGISFPVVGGSELDTPIISAWNGSAFSPQSTNRFVYDGWNLLAAINPQSSILQSFMWGQDVSGTLDQAGGVGGLLMASISGTNCFAAYDGNGNITSLINAGDKSLAARYEYSPYGELIRATGLLARQNPFRFSSKYWDEESGLIYYGLRCYNPNFGKWTSKDLLEERGSINLYVFVLNSPIDSIDKNGLDSYIVNRKLGATGVILADQGAIHSPILSLRFKMKMAIYIRLVGETLLTPKDGILTKSKIKMPLKAQ